MVEKADERPLPATKIRTIMKSCGDPNALLSKESILVVTKAAELFIAYLSEQTHKKFPSKKELNYNDLSRFVQDEDNLEFLHQIIPKKITVKQFREILERGSDSETESTDSEEDSSESEGEEEEEQSDEEENVDDEAENDESEQEN